MSRLASLGLRAVDAFVIAGTLVPLSRADAALVRIFDFPRAQLATLCAAALLAHVRRIRRGPVRRVDAGFALGAAAALGWQLAWIGPYTLVNRRQVQRARRRDPTSRLRLLVSNLCVRSRAIERVLSAVRRADPDVALFVEVDRWWADALRPLRLALPHGVERPQDDPYGMALYSRLPLEDTEVRTLVDVDVPSIRTRVRLPSGARVRLHGVHPRPPQPGKSVDSGARDAELVVVGKEVREAVEPVIVAGDLNDVAWSSTSRLFQRTSGLVDPRVGRGMYSTFHAQVPLMRFPLDHVFHSNDFRLAELRRLEDVGSDHFPILVELSLEPEAARQQRRPRATAEDRRRVREQLQDELEDRARAQEELGEALRDVAAERAVD